MLINSNIGFFWKGLDKTFPKTACSVLVGDLPVLETPSAEKRSQPCPNLTLFTVHIISSEWRPRREQTRIPVYMKHRKNNLKLKFETLKVVTHLINVACIYLQHDLFVGYPGPDGRLVYRAHKSRLLSGATSSSHYLQ